MILIIYILTPFTMTYSIHLFHGFHPNPHDGVCRHPRSPTKSEAEVNFGRMHRPHTLVGIITPYPQSFFQDHFSSLKASISISATLPTCSPSSILALPCITLWTGSTVAPGSIFSSPMNDWCKKNSLCAIGVNTTTCISGLPSQYTLREQTTAASKWPSFRNGNPDSTILSFASSPIPRKVSSKNLRSVWPGHALATSQTQIHSNPCPSNLDIRSVSKPT